MFIYNVSIKILPEIETEWLIWMKTVHMDEVISTGMFDDASLYKLLDPVDDDGITYIAQYKTSSEDRYNTYINQFAQGLRNKGYEKFGNQFIAFRTILKVC